MSRWSSQTLHRNEERVTKVVCTKKIYSGKGFGKYTVILQNNTYPVYGKQKNIVKLMKNWNRNRVPGFAVVIDTK